MGCCQGWDSQRMTDRSFHRSVSVGHCDGSSLKGNSLAEMIAAGYHERTLSATAFDIDTWSDARVRAMAVQDALQHGHFLDPRARDLEDYILALQLHTQWEPLWVLDGVIIDSLSGSQFSEKQPVIRIRVHFDCKVRPSFILAMLENPDLRAKWDYSLQRILVLYVADENYYIKNSVMWTTSPLQTREFVEKCQVREVDNELRLVYYSVTHPVLPTQNFPIREEITRIETLLGMVQIEESNSGVDLTITMQFAASLEKEFDTEIHTLYDWVDRLMREVEITCL